MTLVACLAVHDSRELSPLLGDSVLALNVTDQGLVTSAIHYRKDHILGFL